MERLKSLSLASCNIEGDKNIKNVREFLRYFSPDVVCFQEALEDNVDDLAKMFNYDLAFRSCAVLSKDVFNHLSSDKTLGLAVLSRFPIHEKGSYTYAGDQHSIPIYQRGNPNSSRRELLYASLGENYKIATTHFTWAPDGSVSKDQLEDLDVLIEKAKLLGECLLAGDFNAPRPNEVYQVLTRHFRDNIPLEFTSSLDPKLHRSGKDRQLVVDYIFSTSAFEVTDVKYVEGVSDHKAIFAQVTRKK